VTNSVNWPNRNNVFRLLLDENRIEPAAVVFSMFMLRPCDDVVLEVLGG
jgi:hypothetical protein